MSVAWPPCRSATIAGEAIISTPHPQATLALLDLAGEWPTYPRKAPPLKAGDMVYTDVSFTVTEKGEVADARIEKSGGKVLDEAMLKALRSFRYDAGEKLGVRVKTRLLIRKSYKGG